MAGKKIIKKTTKTLNCVNESEYDQLLYETAIGYKTEDVVEEYAIVEGELMLVKKKVNIKQHPPDLDALRFLIEKQKKCDDYNSLSIDELESKYKDLIGELKTEIEKEINNGDKKATT